MIKATKSTFLVISVCMTLLASCVTVFEHIYDRNGDIPITAESKEWERVADIQLREAAVWTITEGLKLNRAEGLDALKVHYRETWNLTIMLINSKPLESMVQDERIEVSFGAGVRATHLIGVRIEGNTHEFWVVNFAGHSYSFLDREVQFYVTNRSEPSGARVIVHEDTQFISSYETAPGHSIVFPIDNLDLLERMRAWEFPDNYENTDIDDIEVWMDKNLEFRTRKVKR